MSNQMIHNSINIIKYCYILFWIIFFYYIINSVFFPKFTIKKYLNNTFIVKFGTWNKKKKGCLRVRPGKEGKTGQSQCPGWREMEKAEATGSWQEARRRPGMHSGHWGEEGAYHWTTVSWISLFCIYTSSLKYFLSGSRSSLSKNNTS